MNRELYERLCAEVNAIHSALAVAYELPSHKKTAVRSLLHLAMASLAGLKLALLDANWEDPPSE